MSNQTVVIALGLAALGGLATWLYQSFSSPSKEQEELERKKRIQKLQDADNAARKEKEESNTNSQPRLLCYFGSQTGTSEGFAKSIAETSKRFGFAGKVIDLEEFDADEFHRLAREQPSKAICVFTVATYGEGDPSDNAVKFASYLRDESNDAAKPLEGLRFCVFGLGNKQYEQFNSMGKLVNSRLEALGAKRVYKYGEGDDDGSLQEDFNTWMEDLHSALRKEQFGEEAAEEMEQQSQGQGGPQVKPEFQYESKVLTSPPGGNEDLLKSGGRFEESKRKPETGKLDLASRAYFKTEAFPVKLIRELRKSPGPEGRGSTLHVELELPEPIRTYGTAFNLSILPENDMDQVERTAKALGWSSEDLDQWIAIRPRQGVSAGPLLPTPCTLRTALRCGCALNSVPTKSILEKLGGIL